MYVLRIPQQKCTTLWCLPVPSRSEVCEIKSILCVPGSGKTAAFLLPILNQVYENGPAPAALQQNQVTNVSFSVLDFVFYGTPVNVVFSMQITVCCCSFDHPVGNCLSLRCTYLPSISVRLCFSLSLSFCLPVCLRF